MKTINRGLLYLIYAIVTCIVLPECKKDEEPSIQITNLQEIENMYQGDTLKIEYNTRGSGLDSVCLFIDDVIIETQLIPRQSFIFTPVGEGSRSVTLKLGAYYKSGIQKFSELHYVNILNLINPFLYFTITRFDGLSTYFVGEKLSITVHSGEVDGFDNFTQLKLFVNEDDLGTKTSSPFTFITNEIKTAQNNMTIELKDKDNRIHSVKENFTVPVNEPPRFIQYCFTRTQNPGAYILTDSVYLSIIGSDDLMLEHIDVFVDDQKISSYQIKNQIVIKEVNLGVLPLGKHSAYCMAYDDRGASTKSSVLSFNTYGGLVINDIIVDGDYSGSNEMVFLASGSRLYIVNPVNEEISKVVDFPYSDATSVDFVFEENKLYIAFNQGKLLSWDCLSEILAEIPLTNIPGIQDIEIDSQHNAMMVSNKRLLFYNFSTGKRCFGALSLDPGSTLVYDKAEKIVVAGGHPHSSGSYIYTHKLISDSLHYVRRAYIGGFSTKLELNPYDNRFLISGGGNYSAIKSFDMLSLVASGDYKMAYPECATYSSDGNSVFMAANTTIQIFDEASKMAEKSYLIPGENINVNMILTNINNTDLTIVEKDVFSSKVTIVFLRIK